ncbi:myc protein [Lutzomyia longipalpis]|uniref:myc protein n=1 Tax=Lutzomyia longipalpis TaxID=7200 RepID=UPI0024845B86|nr:myc protein [Lutzomyia longipalpis]XP_055683593.1 myc protein [Lutzomyia longipalpis]XP_055683594.1 myc protein [Lutzomyia longipalpis]XP_055683595.1 myc protein [Lutzomyia longipalpis]
MPVKVEMMDDMEFTPSYQSPEFEWEYNVLDLPSSEFMASVEDAEGLFLGLSDICPLRPPSPLLSQSLKHQLLHNHDCMWSGQCGDHSDKTKCPGNHGPPSPILNGDPIMSSGVDKPKSLIKNTTSHNIPAGGSLLRYNQQNKKNPMLSNTGRVAVKKQCDILRPDTPLSLDSDPPEFKHSFDLAACTVGSNKWNLSNTDDDAKIITMLKEHLEDASDGKNDNFKALMGTYRSNSLSDLLTDIKTLSDYEEEDEAEDSAIDTDHDDIVASLSRQESCSVSPQMVSSPISSSQSSMSSTGSHTAGATTGCVEAHSDHCYTRSIDLSGLGVQTPSDSEEEIDVVSVGDKTLPTNPSARDRRTIQTTISDRIVKTTPRGLKTIPPRRIAPDTHGHMTGRTKMSHSVSASPYVHTSRNSGYKGQTVRKGKNDTGRKRSGSKLDGPASKKHKGKKGRVSNTKSARASDICEQDSIEKRNLHNDMERQRRIGLKNLFEALKAQIPSLRDNERAPKVNILREASILCTQLHNESERLNNLKRHHANIQNRLKVIRGHLTSSNVPVPEYAY